MKLRPYEIHVWSKDLAITPDEERLKLALLTHEERVRAERFRLSTHRTRFVAARGTLRQILNIYTGIAPEEIEIIYSEHNKPHLTRSNTEALQFNLAHSHDLAVYAITLTHAIGIDIELVQEKHNPDVAIRYFSSAENEALAKLSPEERNTAFYRIWSRKEALLKAKGKGLSYPLRSFTVSEKAIQESIIIEDEQWALLPLSIHPGYESSLASNQAIHSISFFKFDKDEVVEIK